MRSVLLFMILMFTATSVAADDNSLSQQFAELKPLLSKFCFECHSHETQEGELDLQRFSSLQIVREDVKPWQAMIVQLETREMPPKDQPQPSDEERQRILDWTRRLLESEARARAGDPGYVPLHRLSNSEYNHTVHDLTGIDLQPARDFPADGAAGEGFANAAEALSMSPAMMAKYLNAAKEIADHAVLLPDGFRFSKSATRRDWTDESLASLREFYRPFSEEGNLPLKPYVAALAQHRQELQANKVTLQQLAAEKNLSGKYLEILWRKLESKETSFPLARVQDLWHKADSTDVDAIVAEVSAWFDRLWEFPRIGSYVNSHRQKAKDPAFVESQRITTNVEPEPGQSDVVLYLVSNELSVAGNGQPASVFWSNPRLEGANLPTLELRDYQSFGRRYEIDYSTLFADTERYLAAAVEAANNAKASPKTLAAKHKLDEDWLKRWITVLDVKPLDVAGIPAELGRTVPEVSWQLLDDLSADPGRPAIHGWKPQGTDLPILITNSSDKTEHVPGRMLPHAVAMHPTPTEFVAAIWSSPISGAVRISGKVSHAHPSCGNGVAWFVETRTSTRSAIIAQGAVDLGKETTLAPQQLDVSAGDFICLAVDARDASHICDLTEISLTISEVVADGTGRVWDLAADIANDVKAGNPHADSLGNKDVWSFVRGSAKERPTGSAGITNANNILSRWRSAAATSPSGETTRQLATQLQTLLSGTRPSDDDQVNRELYDQLTSLNGTLLDDFDFSPMANAATTNSHYGLPTTAFGVHPSGATVDARTLVLPASNVTPIRLPAALFGDRQFVVDAGLDASSAHVAVQFQVLSSPPSKQTIWDSSAPVVAAVDGPGQQQLLAGLAEFRDLFPPNVCYPHIIPLDEVVCLKTFHREDEPLIRLFLDDAQTARLERLWLEHRFITKYPIVENEYLPLFIGFVTQDQPQELVRFFEGKRPEFQRWADEFQSEFEAAAPSQWTQLLDFAARAYRRPLLAEERDGLAKLYQTIRSKEVSHEDALRSVLTRVLISPSFLMHLETSPQTAEARAVNDWELASRLSYFLWSSMPDDELRQLAAANRLHEPAILEQQTRRMLKDDRVRALAIEFGTQWIHVRGFDQYNEKNEKLFPMFNAQLRESMYEEATLFFLDLFRSDRRVTNVLNADYTFLNSTLAAHYGIDGVAGEEWRRVDGVQKFGRGGILGFASVQTKQAGASRTSPVLRGNWVVETLLGEKLPRPPPNVPQLPESEIGNGGLTMRQIVEKHVSDAQCASCHQRIDPFGLALERYDPIGRLRDQDLGGLPVDSTATLRDGTEIEGIGGLRDYLLNKKRETFVRLFYQRLLGYSLTRSVSISDQVLIDQMMTATDRGNGGVSNAVVAIVQSPQFRRIRGTGSPNDAAVSP